MLKKAPNSGLHPRGGELKTPLRGRLARIACLGIVTRQLDDARAEGAVSENKRGRNETRASSFL